MTQRKIIENIFSNWFSLAVTVAIAFLVSPIIVHSLGKEMYGIWTLIVSVTGYFTVLDFGVNTAIVRYISSSDAQNDHKRARQIYSTSLAIFAVIAVVLVAFSSIFGLFFRDFFGLHHISRFYLYAVFLLSAVDLACGLFFSVYQGALSGFQEFRYLNATSVMVNIVRSILVVYLLRQGYSLFALALLQLLATFARSAFQYIRIKNIHSYLHFSRESVTGETLKQIYSYSIYSFVIAIALKLLFYTDSIVIGAVIGASEVTFYAIPATILDYVEKLVWAMIAVLVPVISANEATGGGENNANLYVMGTRYSLLISMPIVISLYVYGDDFIRLWMGPEIGMRSTWVLRFLLIGFGFSFSQLIAHGILKGISKHKVLAYILALEALANLGMSIALARPHGIEGVAVGTMVPLIVASLAIILYTCRILGLNVLSYLARAYSGALAGFCVTLVIIHFIDPNASSYAGVFLESGLISVVFLGCAVPLGVSKEHRASIVTRFRNLFCSQSE